MKPKKRRVTPTEKFIAEYFRTMEERIMGLMLAQQAFASDFCRVGLERVDMEKALLGKLGSFNTAVNRLADEIAHQNLHLEELIAGVRQNTEAVLRLELPWAPIAQLHPLRRV